MAEAIDMTQFVPKYFEMDPKTDDLLRKGSMLEDGMVVLLEMPALRVDIVSEDGQPLSTYYNPETREQALRYNRWVTVSDLGWADGDMCSFIGVYHDGTKKKIEAPNDFAWYVKKNSLPKPIDYEAEQRDQQERGRPVEAVRAALSESMRLYGPRPS